MKTVYVVETTPQGSHIHVTSGTTVENKHNFAMIDCRLWVSMLQQHISAVGDEHLAGCSTCYVGVDKFRSSSWILVQGQ